MHRVHRSSPFSSHSPTSIVPRSKRGLALNRAAESKTEAATHREITDPPEGISPIDAVKWKLQGPPISLSAPFVGIERVYKTLGPDAQSFIWRPLPGKSLYSFRGPTEIAYVLRNAELFRKSDRIKRVARFFGNGLPVQHSVQQHKLQRDLLSPSFRPDYVRSLLPEMARRAERLSSVLLEKGQADLQDMSRRYTFDLVGSTIFGAEFGALAFASAQARGGQGGGGADGDGSLATNGQDPLELWDEVLVVCQRLIADLPIPNEWVPGYPRFEAGVQRLEKLIEGVIAQRFARGIQPEDRDLLSYILRQKSTPEGSWITEEALRDELMSFLFAASDTTATLTTLLCYSFASQPELVGRLREEMERELGAPLGEIDVGALTFDKIGRLQLLTGTINECMRLWPSATEIARIPTRDVELGGAVVPEGKTCVLAIYSMHRNPLYWERPEEFIPERWTTMKDELGPRHPDAFLPFGTGTRSCIGRHQAIAEASAAALVLLKNLDFSLPPGFEGGSEGLALTSQLGLKLKGGMQLVAKARRK